MQCRQLEARAGRQAGRHHMPIFHLEVDSGDVRCMLDVQTSGVLNAACCIRRTCARIACALLCEGVERYRVSTPKLIVGYRAPADARRIPDTYGCLMQSVVNPKSPDTACHELDDTAKSTAVIRATRVSRQNWFSGWKKKGDRS